jgi:hypothetical protein
MDADYLDFILIVEQLKKVAPNALERARYYITRGKAGFPEANAPLKFECHADDHARKGWDEIEKALRESEANVVQAETKAGLKFVKMGWTKIALPNGGTTDSQGKIVYVDLKTDAEVPENTALLRLSAAAKGPDPSPTHTSKGARKR